MMDDTEGKVQVTLDRDDVQHLLDGGTSRITKTVGPISVSIRCHDRLEPVVMVSGRNKDPDPEVIGDE